MKGKILWIVLGISVMALAQEVKKPVVNMYVIKKGDTLWDISSRFLANPWLWPKIWEQNKYIENPDLIFPGEPLILPETAALPPAPPAEAIPKEVTPPPPPPEAVEVPSEEKVGTEVVALPPPEVPEETLVSEEGKELLSRIAELQKAEKTSVYFSRMSEVAFITDTELEAAGKIVGSPEERTIFAELDRVYIEFKEEVGAGELFHVVEEMGVLTHPVTKKKLGRKIKILGVVEVLEKNDKNYTALIKTSTDAIRKGNRVLKAIPITKTVEIKKASSPLEGYVVDGNRFGKFFGEGDVVFIDLGSEKGVEEGNVFIVYIQQKEKPLNLIGKAVVIRTWKNASAALLTKTRQEVERGHKVIADVF